MNCDFKLYVYRSKHVITIAQMSGEKPKYTAVRIFHYMWSGIRFLVSRLWKLKICNINFEASPQKVKERSVSIRVNKPNRM